MMTSTSSSGSRLTSREAAIEASLDRLAADSKEVRSAAAVLHGTPSPNRQRYETQISRALATMEVDIGLARAAFDANDAVTPDDLHDTMRQVDESARRWLDDLAVRAHLARKEFGDRAAQVEHRLDRARGEVHRATTRIDDAIESDIDAMRVIALHSIREVRDAVGDSVDAIFHYVP
jgi:hypothetical protein